MCKGARESKRNSTEKERGITRYDEGGGVKSLSDMALELSIHNLATSARVHFCLPKEYPPPAPNPFFLALFFYI